MKPEETNRLIDELIDGVISDADFIRLEAELSCDAAARAAYFERIALAQSLGEAARELPPAKSARVLWWRSIPAMAMAALFLVVGLLASLVLSSASGGSADPVGERTGHGFAILAGQVDAVWAGPAPLADGSLLPAGKVGLKSGVAQIDLFSGVSLVVEGQAEFEISSPMEVRVHSGKIRARVPEPAHGFKLRTAEGDVVDLGTEFAVRVTDRHSEIHVLEGAVEWYPAAKEMRNLGEGQALRWSADGRATALTPDSSAFVGGAQLVERIALRRKSRQTEWGQYHAGTLADDARLVAYYKMGAVTGDGRTLPNMARAGTDRGSAGTSVGAARVPDRWGDPYGALDFSPEGSRVRLNVPGVFGSLTLLTWVKINSLDRQYNSLFLTDGHDANEPHWQLMEDGRIFFAVKKFPELSGGKDSRKSQQVFFSPKVWTPARSGQWLMLATTYDVDARKVCHFLDGRLVSEEAIASEFMIDRVAIGAASLGNWEKPMRDEPRFAIRNLNGSMDSFALYSAALTPREIQDIYEHGRP